MESKKLFSLSLSPHVRRQAMRWGTFRLAAFSVLGLVSVSAGAAHPSMAAVANESLSFRVSFGAAVRTDPADGRVYVIIDRKDATAEPRFGVKQTLTVPFWGKDIARMQPGQQVTLDSSPEVYGFPYELIGQLPEGDYTVQGFLNIYTTVHRSDGRILQVHFPAGDGGRPFDSPGNLYSTPVQLHLSPDSGPIELVLDKVVQPADPVPPGGTPQQGNPPESEHVKQLKIRSDLVSKFWGLDMYMGATVLLPRDYDNPKNRDRKYPIVYAAGHYSERPPYNFVEPGSGKATNEFSIWWLSDKTPRFMIVTWRSENPYYDDSYYVNTANMGPYGDATLKELIPAIEKRFRIYAEPWARTIEGCSTGGGIAAYQVIFYPKFWCGAWPGAPDQMDFRAYELVNIYSDPNAYVWDKGPIPGSIKVPRLGNRTPQGDSIWTIEQENDWEHALATKGRSQWGDWDMWQALYGPVGPDGYPAALWDKETGVIDHDVANAWKPMDMSIYVTEHWPTIGKDLSGKLHYWVGTNDSYFLNLGVQYFQQETDKLTNPKTYFTFDYIQGAGHCGAGLFPRGGTVGRLTEMTRTMRDAALHRKDKWWWNAIGR